MGAVINLRPDLFKAVVSQVPFVDVINTMLDESLPLTVGEFEEWGNPKIKERVRVHEAVLPLHEPGAQGLPHPAREDELQRFPGHVLGAREVRREAANLKTDQNPLVLKTNLDAGHGGASGRYDALQETAFDYAFVLSQLGFMQ